MSEALKTIKLLRLMNLEKKTQNKNAPCPFFPALKIIPAGSNFNSLVILAESPLVIQGLLIRYG